MKSATIDRLNALLANGYEFDFGGYFSLGYEIWGKWWYAFSGYALLAGLMSGVANQIPYVGPIANLVLDAGLGVGYVIVARQIAKGQSPDFSGFFAGFQHIGPLLLVAIVQVVVILGLLLLSLLPVIADFPLTALYSSGTLEQGEILQEWMLSTDPTNFLFIGLAFFPILYLVISWMFAPMLVIFEGAGFWEAMEWSRKIVGKHWFLFFLMTIALGLVAMVGVIGLCIGVFATASLAQVIIYAMYHNIVGNSDEDEMNIEDHFVPENQSF